MMARRICRDIATCGKIHHRVGAILHGVVKFFQLLGDVRGRGGIADIGVDLTGSRNANGHRLKVRVIDVGGDNHTAARNLVSNQLGGQKFAPCDVLHLRGDDAATRVVHLRPDSIIVAFCYPLCSHNTSIMTGSRPPSPDRPDFRRTC